MCAELWRQDRPGHVGKTAREKRRRQFDDMMFRLEPRDKVRVTFAADFSEADEGMHLVFVAPHRSCHRLYDDNVGIGCDLQKVMLSAQSPQQAVKQREPLAVTVQD